MRIAVIGGGELGGSLAEWWTQAGHEVMIGALKPDPGQTSVPEAATFGDVLLFSPAWEDARETLEAAGDTLLGKPLLDTTNPATREDLSGLEILAGWAPGAQWAKAFNTLTTDVRRRRRGHDPLLTEFICSDSPAARAAATTLIRDAGLAPVFAGGADSARLTETGGPLHLLEVDVTDATAVLARALSPSGA